MDWDNYYCFCIDIYRTTYFILLQPEIVASADLKHCISKSDSWISHSGGDIANHCYLRHKSFVGVHKEPRNIHSGGGSYSSVDQFWCAFSIRWYRRNRGN